MTVVYKRSHWKAHVVTQHEAAATIAHLPGLCKNDLLEEILKVLTPAQFEQVAKAYGYEAVV